MNRKVLSSDIEIKTEVSLSTLLLFPPSNFPNLQREPPNFPIRVSSLNP